MTEIRAFRPEDLDDLYRICLATALAGGDASGLYQDRKLVGHVYAVPYAVLSPETVFVIGGADRVGGYIVGAPDTRDCEARLEAAWWPSLRATGLAVFVNWDAVRRGLRVPSGSGSASTPRTRW
jgi:hypothetical protein